MKEAEKHIQKKKTGFLKHYISESWGFSLLFTPVVTGLLLYFNTVDDDDFWNWIYMALLYALNIVYFVYHLVKWKR